MSDFLPLFNSPDNAAIDRNMQQQIQRLYKFVVYLRWIKVALLWLLIAPLSLWGLRHEFPLWFDYFTWTAVRYSLAYNPLPAIGLSICVGLTVSTTLWQSYNALFGLSPQYLYQLEQQVLEIRQRGKRNWLRRKICGKIN